MGYSNQLVLIFDDKIVSFVSILKYWRYVDKQLINFISDFFGQ